MKEPRIRIKGFENNWKMIKFSTIARRVTRKNSHLETTLPLTISAAEGLISQISFFNNIVASSNLSGYYLIKNGEFAYNKSTSAGYPFGSVKRLDKYDKGALSTLYIVFNMLDDVSSDYITYFFDTSLWYKEVAMRVFEGARNHGLLNIGANDFLDINILLPVDKKEQQAIADFFQSLDSMINLTSKKIEKLKHTLTGCMQTMFPQEGELEPKVRFKGFDGEWGKVLLSDCLEISNERNKGNILGKDKVLSVSDDYGVMNQIKLLGRSYAGVSVENYKVLRKDQIVYTKSPLKLKPYGIIKVNKGYVGIVSVLYAVYNVKEGIDPDFIHFYFEPSYRINNYLLPLISKGAKHTMNISDDNALNGYILIPSKDEQSKIANYLNSLSEMISLQSKRLNLLKHIKSACLDNMFV